MVAYDCDRHEPGGSVCVCSVSPSDVEVNPRPSGRRGFTCPWVRPLLGGGVHRVRRQPVHPRSPRRRRRRGAGRGRRSGCLSLLLPAPSRPPATQPERYLVGGDAACSFDPRSGQRMSVAIIEALELRRVLDVHGLDGIGLRVQKAAQWAVQDAWDLPTGSDLVHPEVDGPRRRHGASRTRTCSASCRWPTTTLTAEGLIGSLVLAVCVCHVSPLGRRAPHPARGAFRTRAGWQLWPEPPRLQC